MSSRARLTRSERLAVKTATNIAVRHLRENVVRPYYRGYMAGIQMLAKCLVDSHETVRICRKYERMAHILERVNNRRKPC